MARENAGSRLTRMGSRTMVAETVAAQKQADSLPPARTSEKTSLIRPLFLVPHRLTPAERHRLISELAYRRAEHRGFTGGNEVDDWLEAEREVDAGRY